jgi:c-di-GMP-binding flagellar brake protein YcgR
MSFEHEQRKYPRLSITGGAYEIHFQIKGTEILNSRLVNLSAGGCGLEVQLANARHIEIGETVECLHLDHPDLPLVPLSAVVLRILGKVPGKTSGYVLLGLEYQDITPFIRGHIAEHVDSQMSQA